MSYKGDDNLEKLLLEHSSDYSLSDIYNFVSSVLATPENSVFPQAWTELITKDAEFSEQLSALKAQIFSTKEKDNSSIQSRVSDLRSEMDEQEIDGFIVPRSDEYQGEYVSAQAERLEYITGFGGSAGQAVILKDSAVFLTDGRYTLQSEKEVPTDTFDLRKSGGRIGGEKDLAEWLKENVSAGKKIGYDPWLHGLNAVNDLNTLVNEAGGVLVPVEKNPIDAVWNNQPPAPLSPVVPHPAKYAGKSSKDKRQKLASELKEHKCDATALTLPEDIAWLLNIRGGDVPCTPLPLSFAIANDDTSVDLFIDKRKLSDSLDKHFDENIRIHDINEFVGTLKILALNNKTVLLDPNKTPVKVFNVLEDNGAEIVKERSLCQLPKAIKNATEQQGTIRSHIRDGVALTRFLYQLSKPEVVAGLTEMSAADMLEGFRKEGDDFRGLSFDTISGAGSNGAVIHYRVSEETDKPLNSGPVYLVDSGGQYLDGTTDVTRTVAVGDITDEVKDRFTRVLKGHINVAMQEFTEGTTGAEFDKISREALKEVGLNYPHSLGHGVGSYLSVHEGPQGLYPSTTVPLKEGMIVSNEPGYYEDGKYGIRIESLVLVECGEFDAAAEIDTMKFKTLTMAPIDINLIKNDLLTEKERNWLNNYHAEVQANLLPKLEEIDQDAAKWLKEVTKPLTAKVSPAYNNKKTPSAGGM